MANKSFSLESFAQFAAERAATANPYLVQAVGVAGRAIYNRAQSTMGDNTKLRSLKQSTQADREAHGYTPDDPLVASGSLRQTLELHHEGLVAGVGSSDPRMAWHELGYYNVRAKQIVPPRPALRIAAQTAKDENWLVVRHYAAKMVGVNMEGGGTGYAVMGGENIANQYTGTLKRQFVRVK